MKIASKNNSLKPVHKQKNGKTSFFPFFHYIFKKFAQFTLTIGVQ
jgi:hypothetical protein